MPRRQPKVDFPTINSFISTRKNQKNDIVAQDKSTWPVLVMPRQVQASSYACRILGLLYIRQRWRDLNHKYFTFISFS